METSDARKLVGAVLEERRKQVIRLYHWQKGGNRTLKTQKRGRPVGCCRRLLPHKESKIRKDIVDHCPDQLKLPFALWTRQAIFESR